MGLLNWFKERKKEKAENIKMKDMINKESIVNFAFDNGLKEGLHYTVQAKVGNAKLVKKVVRWESFDTSGKFPYAMFSIETDKGLYCFQYTGGNLLMVETEIAVSIYPQLAPEDYFKNQEVNEENESKIKSNNENGEQ